MRPRYLVRAHLELGFRPSRQQGQITERAVMRWCIVKQRKLPYLCHISMRPQGCVHSQIRAMSRSLRCTLWLAWWVDSQPCESWRWSSPQSLHRESHGRLSTTHPKVTLGTTAQRDTYPYAVLRRVTSNSSHNVASVGPGMLSPRTGRRTLQARIWIKGKKSRCKMRRVHSTR